MHCCGAPGLDRLARLAVVPREELAARVGLPLRRPDPPGHLPSGDARAGDTEAHVEELAAALGRDGGRRDHHVPRRRHRLPRRSMRRLEALAAARARTRGWSRPRRGHLLLAAARGRRDGRQLLERAHRGAVLRAARSSISAGASAGGCARRMSSTWACAGRDPWPACAARSIPPSAAGLAGLRNPYGDGHAAPRIVRVLADGRAGPAARPEAFRGRSGPSDDDRLSRLAQGLPEGHGLAHPGARSTAGTTWCSSATRRRRSRARRRRTRTSRPGRPRAWSTIGGAPRFGPVLEAHGFARWSGPRSTAS